MDDVLHATEFLGQLELVDYWTDPYEYLERSYVSWIKFTPFFEPYDFFPRRDL